MSKKKSYDIEEERYEPLESDRLISRTTTVVQTHHFAQERLERIRNIHKQVDLVTFLNFSSDSSFTSSFALFIANMCIRKLYH
jgi:hypothetical protein